jgi:hypothetical protein
MRLLPAFALGNLVPALVLGLGCYALPLRWWGMDVPVALVVTGLLASSAAALRKPELAPRLLRGAAIALLVLGLGLVAAFGLSVAFLAGVNGPFGAFGMLLMGLVVALVAPYALVYPALQLWWLGRERESGGGNGSDSGSGSGSREEQGREGA